jgi:hypothetical protein
MQKARWARRANRARKRRIDPSRGPHSAGARRAIRLAELEGDAAPVCGGKGQGTVATTPTSRSEVSPPVSGGLQTRAAPSSRIRNSPCFGWDNCKTWLRERNSVAGDIDATTMILAGLREQRHCLRSSQRGVGSHMGTRTCRAYRPQGFGRMAQCDDERRDPVAVAAGAAHGAAVAGAGDRRERMVSFSLLWAAAVSTPGRRRL